MRLFFKEGNKFVSIKLLSNKEKIMGNKPGEMEYIQTQEMSNLGRDLVS